MEITQKSVQFLKSPELGNLFIDALVTDEANNLLFLSAWGTESYIQPIRAKFILPVHDKGLAGFRAYPPGDDERKSAKIRVNLDQRRRLQDATGRPARSAIFIHLTHLWVYDRLATAPDQAQSRALLLKKPGESEEAFRQQLWQIVQTVCRVPLHVAWDFLLVDFQRKGWIKRHPGFGVEACLLHLPEAEVAAFIGQRVQQGILKLPEIH